MTRPQKVHGAWRLGWTLDVHTVSSEFMGYDESGHELFNTIRSELGELLFQLKYRQQDTAHLVAQAMADFLVDKPNLLHRTDIVVPVPASKARYMQPVVEIARQLGDRLGKPVVDNAVRKIKETTELKAIDDPDTRRELLDDSFRADTGTVQGRGVLLIDDLYRSGATANAVACALLRAGATHVYFLAVTRTRSNA